LADIEALIEALGTDMSERAGARVAVVLFGCVDPRTLSPNPLTAPTP